MPRANRYILPGYIYHVTHRCHDRQFLLKFAKDRNGYRRRLRQAVQKHELSLLSYNLTSNHVHLIAFSDFVEQIARVMQCLLAVNKLLQLLGNPSLKEFREHFGQALREAITQDRVKRQGCWTDSLAVGSQEFVETMEAKVRNRQETHYLQEGSSWILRECYGTLFDAKKSPIQLTQGPDWA